MAVWLGLPEKEAVAVAAVREDEVPSSFGMGGLCGPMNGPDVGLTEVENLVVTVIEPQAGLGLNGLDNGFESEDGASHLHLDELVEVLVMDIGPLTGGKLGVQLAAKIRSRVKKEQLPPTIVLTYLHLLALRVLRKALRNWNWEVFGDVNRRVDADLAALVALQNGISDSGGTNDDFAKEYYCDTRLISRAIPSLITDDENMSLTSVPSSEEIYLALKDMDPDSAPGHDGFNGHFFVSCWATVGADIIPKILSLRLASIASRIISPQQHAFVPGRNIADCIITTSKCINLLDSKCHGGNVAIKMDITKAFDTLSWDFILHVLEAFDFHPTFVSWVRAILHSAKLSLLVNERVVGYFSCGRGVRQGDPLSLLLFCLAEEVLSRGISELLNNGRLKPISSPQRVVAPSHVLFADDVIVFCQGDQRNLSLVKSLFDEYG
ncbi:hypothetical protein ACLB2K_071953 [Fragaria x ananassa]